jgi:hypothetical protein
MIYLLDSNVWGAILRKKHPEVAARYGATDPADVRVCSVVLALKGLPDPSGLNHFAVGRSAGADPHLVARSSSFNVAATRYRPFRVGIRIATWESRN